MTQPFATDEQLATVRVIPEEERLHFLPRLFSHALMLVGESSVYAFMNKLSADYGGGFWAFKEVGNGALYMAPDSEKRFAMRWEGNGYMGEMSSDAAGITATLFALSHAGFVYRNHDRLAEAYELLLTYAARHAEASEIFRAID